MKILDTLTSFDLLGSPIVLNFRGRASYKTCSGGCITISTLAFFAFLCLKLLIQVLNYEELVIQTYTVVEIPDGEPVNLRDNKLLISVNLVGFEDQKIDPRAGTLSLTHTHRPGSDNYGSNEP